MIGKYTFKQHGDIIGVHHNLITTTGRKAIIDYMAGYITSLVGGISVGIGSQAAVVGDKSLQFEIARTPVQVASADYAAGGVVYKGTLSSEVEATIYEAGAHTIYDPLEQYDSQTLFTFDGTNELWTVGSYVSTNSRVGSALQLTAAASATTTSVLTDLALDMSGFSATDQFTIAYRANNAFVASLVVRLKTDDANYYTYTINTPASGVYTITSFNKSAMTATGTPDWANITKAEVAMTSTGGGGGSIDFDAIRVEDRDYLREESVLVSRSVLGTPVVKTAGIPLDIEYAITI